MKATGKSASKTKTKEKKKPVYDTKKKKGPSRKELEEKKAEEEAAVLAEQAKRLDALKLAEEQKAAVEAEAEKARADAAAKKPEEDELLDDWEAAADADDGIKDSSAETIGPFLVLKYAIVAWYFKNLNTLQLYHKPYEGPHKLVQLPDIPSTL